MKLQVTLFDKGGHYKPISTIVEIESMEYYNNNKAEVQKRAILNICHQRYTSWEHLKKEGFTSIKVREYDKEKIEQAKKIAMIKKLLEKRTEKK